MQATTRILEDRLAPLLVVVDQILRDVSSVLERIRRGDQLAVLAKASILTVAVCAGEFGATLGMYRGGAQILFAMVKLPLAVLVTVAICAPLLSAINAALGREVDLRRDLALVLSSLARASLVLAACAPVVLLAVKFKVDYHDLLLLVVACCGAAGAVGLTFLLRGLWRAERRGLLSASVVLLGVMAAVGAQMSWTLRPFLVRPRTVEVPFVRSIEGSFLDSVFTSSRSARGIYHAGDER